MPWSEKQNALFRAIEHGWRPPRSSGIRISRADATRMAHEGIKKAEGGALGGKGLIEAMRRMSPNSRFDYLRENAMKNITGENAMMAALGSDASPLQFHGGLPDYKLMRGRNRGMNMAFMPSNRRRFMMFDTRRPDAQGHASEIGSLAANWGEGWMPKDMIDLDILKQFQKQGYGKETLAMMLSNLKNEGDKFQLYDVKRSAKPYWESLGATIDDPSRPFRTKDKRNNNYHITPGDFLRSFADGGPVMPMPMPMPLSPETPAFRNQSLAEIEGPINPYAIVARRRGGVIRRAMGGSIQDQAQEFGPRAAALKRINAQIQQSRDPFGRTVPAAMTSRLGARSGPTLSRYSGPAWQSVLRPAFSSQMQQWQYGSGMPGLTEYAPGFAGGGYAGGGETDEGGSISDYLPLAAMMLRPKHINAMARPFGRALAKPVFATEAVTKHPLTRSESHRRFRLAQEASGHPFAEIPAEIGQGAWMGERGMEFNPLHMQTLPRRLGKITEHEDALRYAAQMGENLNQSAVPVSRFVKNLLNTEGDANAMMIHDINEPGLKSLAELLGPDVVAAHRPGKKAMVFPLGDQKISDLATEVRARFSSPRIDFGRSDPGVDRALLSKSPLGYEDMTYAQAGASPREDAFARIEKALRDSPRGLFPSLSARPQQ